MRADTITLQYIKGTEPTVDYSQYDEYEEEYYDQSDYGNEGVMYETQPMYQPEVPPP